MTSNGNEGDADFWIKMEQGLKGLDTDFTIVA